MFVRRMRIFVGAVVIIRRTTPLLDTCHRLFRVSACTGTIDIYEVSQIGMCRQSVISPRWPESVVFSNL